MKQIGLRKYRSRLNSKQAARLEEFLSFAREEDASLVELRPGGDEGRMIFTASFPTGPPLIQAI